MALLDIVEDKSHESTQLMFYLSFKDLYSCYPKL
jgi:hypothetical protein